MVESGWALDFLNGWEKMEGEREEKMTKQLKFLQQRIVSKLTADVVTGQDDRTDVIGVTYI
jgi:hypothetical protein